MVFDIIIEGERGIEHFFYEYRKYNEFMEEQIEMQQNELQKQYESINWDEIEQDNPEYAAAIGDEFIEENHKYIGFSHNFRAFYLAQIYSVIEYELLSICGYLGNKDETVKNFKGRYIDDAKSYLKEYFKIDFNNLNPECNDIDKFRIIRNKIIHHKSRVSQRGSDCRDISNFIKNRNGIELDNDPEEIIRKGEKRIYKSIPFYITNKTLNDEFLSTAESFFKKLLTDHLDELLKK